MAHFLSRYDLYDFAVRGIKAFVNNAVVTTETTVPAGAVLKLIAYNGGVFTRVYFLDPVELVELNFSLTGTKKEALAYVPSWNGALHYTGTFKPFPGPPPTPPVPDPVPEPEPTKPTVLTIQPGSIEGWAANNLVMEVGGVPVISGQEITSEQVITLKATGNYSIVFAKLGTYSFVISPDKKLGTLQLPGTVSFVSSAMAYETEPPPPPPTEPPPPPPPPTPAPTVLTIQPGSIEEWATNNLRMEVGGVPVVSGQEIKAGQLITLRSTSNYDIVYAGFTDPVELETYAFAISPNKKSGTLQLPGTVSFVSSAMEYVTELGADIPVDVKGSNSVYKIADSDLETITTSRFQTVTSTGNLIDYGQFILGFIKIPFEVDPSLIVGSEEVRLGPVRTGVAGQVISRDRLVVPLGSISVPAVDLNSLDYQSTSCKLHLPYANPVSVDVQHVIGETIEIALSINLYDGEAQYTLKGSKFNQVFDTVTCYLDVAIPFANVVGGIPNKNNPSNVSVGVDNGIRTAFIEVERKPREMPEGFFTTAVNVEGALLGQVGYFEVSNCELKVRATHEELERLRTALRDGVIIK